MKITGYSRQKVHGKPLKHNGIILHGKFKGKNVYDLQEDKVIEAETELNATSLAIDVGGGRGRGISIQKSRMTPGF